MSYQSDINNKYYAISATDAFAVLKALDSKALAGTGSAVTNETKYVDLATGGLDGNLKIKVNGTYYDLKNTHAYLSNQRVYSNNAVGWTSSSSTSQIYNLYDVVAIAKAAGYDNEAISNALDDNYKADIKTLIDAKDTFKSQREFRAKPWTPERVAELNSTTGPAYDSLKNWLDDNYPGAVIETTLDPLGNKYHYRIRVGNQWVDIEDPDGKEYTPAFLDKNVKQNGVVANVLQNQIEANNQAINSERYLDILNKFEKNIASGANAKTNFDLTDADYKALKVLLPDLDDHVAANGVIDSKWVSTIGDRLTQQLPSTYEGDSLSEFMKSAQDGNDAGTLERQAALDKASSVIQKFKSNPELYNAIASQLNTDAYRKTTAGQTAANIGKVAQEVDNSGASAKAVESLAALADAGAEGLAGTERSEIYGRDTKALSDYTDTQLSKLSTDQQLNSIEVDKLRQIVEDYLTAMGVEEARARRFVQDEISRADSYADIRKANANAESAESIEKNKVYVGSDKNIVDLLDQLLADNSADHTKAFDKVDEVSGGKKYTDTGALRVNPNLVDPNKQYLDESVYDKVIADADSKYKNILTQEAFNKYTKAPTLDDLADSYGLDYLKSVDSTIDKFTEAAGKANEASDRMLTQAQRAYLSALAAGDAKTIEALTQLAGTASAPKQNLLNASTLAQQFAQQQKDAAVGTELVANAQQQRATNAKQLAEAESAGREAWKNWLGSGDSNKDKGLYSSFMQGAANSTNALDYYNKLLQEGMKYESNINNLISDAAQATNKNLTDLATTFTGLNSSGLVSNIANSAEANALKNSIAVKKQAIYDGNQQLQNIVNTGNIDDPTKPKTTTKTTK